MTSHEAPPLRPVSARIKWGWDEICNIIMHSDIRFACVVLGATMCLWAIFGMFRQSDLAWFASGFAFEVSPWVWALNHLMVGYGFIHVAIHRMPKGRCLMLGTYGAMIWGWIALGRPNASFSSGAALNIVIIFMSMLITQRSGVAHK